MSSFLTDSRHRATRREVQLASQGISGMGQIEKAPDIYAGGLYSGYTEPIPAWDPRNPLSSLSDSFLALFIQPAAMGQGTMQTVGQSPAGYGDKPISQVLYENRTLIYIAAGAVVALAVWDAAS